MVYRPWTMDKKQTITQKQKPDARSQQPKALTKKTPDVKKHRAFAINNLTIYLAATTRTFTLNSSAMALSPKPSKKLLEP